MRFMQNNYLLQTSELIRLEAVFLYYLSIIMKHVQQIRYSYQTIQSKTKGYARKLLLQSIKKQLLQLQASTKEDLPDNKIKLEITETNDTNSSRLSLMSNCFSNDISGNQNILTDSIMGTDELLQLQANIIQKQRHKIALNQEIQSLEDQYFGLQQKIYVKREKVANIQKQIVKKSYQISKHSMEEVVEVEESSSIAKKIMNFFLF